MLQKILKLENLHKADCNLLVSEQFSKNVRSNTQKFGGQVKLSEHVIYLKSTCCSFEVGFLKIMLFGNRHNARCNKYGAQYSVSEVPGYLSKPGIIL